MNCEICLGQKVYEILDLGYQPPSDAFLTEEKLNEPETQYPLKVIFCENCELVQLSYAVDPKILFTDNYVYRLLCFQFWFEYANFQRVDGDKRIS